MKRVSIITSAVAATSIFIISSSAYAAYGQHYKGDYAPRYRPVANYKAEMPTEPLYNCCNRKVLMDGMYVGLDVSYDSFKIGQNIEAIGGDLLISHNPSLSLNGWDGAVFAGYGRYFDWFYMGGEILAKTTNAKNNYSLTIDNLTVPGPLAYNLKIRARQSYGIGILPGFKLNDSTLLYARIDYIRTLIDTSETISIPGGSLNPSRSVWSNGVDYGLGLETAVWERLSLRVEYTYTTYNNFFTNAGSKFDPANNQVDVGLLLHFC